MINDNRSFILRVKAASRLKAYKKKDQNQFVLDSNRERISSNENADFNKSFKTLLTQASNAMREGNYDSAIHNFTNILKNSPEDYNVIVDRAICFHRLRKTNLALKDLDTILLDHPDHARALLTKAEILYEVGEFKSALSLFESGMKIRKDMTAFAIGAEKAKRSIEMSPSQTLVQPDALLDLASKQKNVLAELDVDFNFLSEYEKNTSTSEATKAEIDELIDYIKKQQERLAKI